MKKPLIGVTPLLDTELDSLWMQPGYFRLVEQAGGIVTGKIAVLAEGDAANRTDIKFLEKLPLFNADGTVKN